MCSRTRKDKILNDDIWEKVDVTFIEEKWQKIT